MNMKWSLSLVQLPFPNSDYFPEPTYLSASERWYREVVSPNCTIPTNSLSEVPAWISWVRAALLAATRKLTKQIDIQIIDLSRIAFDIQSVLDEILLRPRSKIYLFSPLTQNSILTTQVAKALREEGYTVVAGGPAADTLNSQYFDSIFVGRIETHFHRFLTWLSNLCEMPRDLLSLSPGVLTEYLDYDWCVPYRQSGILYMRTFSQHGCPFSCIFCASRQSPLVIVDPLLLQRDISSLCSCFADNNALYIGDLTFGISRESMSNLGNVLDHIAKHIGREFKLIVQIDPALVTPLFVEELGRLGVVLVEMGIESGSPSAVRRTGKVRPSSDWLENKIVMLNKSGIRIAGNIIVGLPYDSDDDYRATIKFILKWRTSMWFNIYGFVPYPNTPLYAQLVRDNRIKNWNTAQWCEGAEFVFEPYRMSAASAYTWFRQILGASLFGMGL